MASKKALPPGMRQPSFDNLLVEGTNAPSSSRLPSGEQSCAMGPQIDLLSADLASPIPTTRDIFSVHDTKVLDEECSIRANVPTARPVLQIRTFDDDNVTIYSKPEGVSIFIQLHAKPKGTSAMASLTLTNPGPEALSFGLSPYDYPEPLWPTEKYGLIYFLQPEGVLEEGNVHILTAVYESHAYGNFAESYKMWLLPKGTKPDNIVIVVNGTSEGRTENTGQEKDENETCLNSATNMDIMASSLEVEHRLRNLLHTVESTEAPKLTTLEEIFMSENNLEYQAEPVTKLLYIWIFIHLHPDSIPWYQCLIETEIAHRNRHPGEVTKVMLDELAAAHATSSLSQTTNPPAYLYNKTPSSTEFVYWKDPHEIFKCDVHDKDFPLPDSASKPDDRKIHVNVTPIAADADRHLIRKPPPQFVSEPPRFSINGSTVTEKTENEQLPQRITTDTGYSKPEKPQQSRLSEPDSEWAPVQLVNDEKSNPQRAVIQRKAEATKPPAFSLTMRTFNAPQDPPPPPDPEKLALDALVDERWRQFWMDQEWIKTAVTYALNKHSNPNTPKPVVPTWDYRIKTLKEHIHKSSSHNIFVKLALIREIMKVQQTLIHLKPRCKLNFNRDEEIEQLILATLETIVEKTTVYARDLYGHFEKYAAQLTPEEPAVPVELQKAREKIRVDDTAASVKSGSKGKKLRTPDTGLDEQSSNVKTRSARDSGEKTALAVNRPSKSGVSSAKSSIAGKDLKRGASANANAESSKSEKDTKQQLLAIEAEYDAAMEIYEAKMTEFRQWRQEKEMQLGPKIRSFFISVWEQELSYFHDSITKSLQLTRQLEEKALDDDYKREIMAKREVTLNKLYENLVESGGNVAIAAAAWRKQISGDIMRDDEKKKYREINDKWEQRRREVEVWRKDRPRECYRMVTENIWHSPYIYEKQAELEEPIPRRHREGMLPNDGVRKVEQNLPKAADGARKILPGTAAMTEHPSSTSVSVELRYAASGKTVLPQVQQALAAASILQSAISGINSLQDEKDKEETATALDQDDWITEKRPKTDIMYTPMNAETEAKLPSDFKLVSFKQGSGKNDLNNDVLVQKRAAVADFASAKEAHSSSSDED
ncbi:uncharacterized protein LOC129586907 isoform X2 [Paramacrobiotus metropolitanus]|nr:uncharacterized protein LOC129586907 isoform X2 [Paramacrobiotus metropolitanus]